MICEQTTDWIWETPHPEDPPPEEVRDHLTSCAGCAGELEARRAVFVRLRKLRLAEEEDPPAGLDRMVLDAAYSAVQARASGDFGALREEVQDEFTSGMGAAISGEMTALLSGEFGAIDDETADEIAESIAEQYGSEIAAMTTNRLKVATDPAPDVPPESPRSQRPLDDFDPGDGESNTQSPSTAAPWLPPRASTGWMFSAAALLMATAAIGFLAGRTSGVIVSSSELPTIHTTIATGLQRAGGDDHPRLHDVSLSQGAVQALSEGNTYLLTGPVGGPYEVVGIVGWDTMDKQLQAHRDDQGEIVIAVGPAGGWSRGAQLAVSALADPGVEIIGRRALP